MKTAVYYCCTRAVVKYFREVTLPSYEYVQDNTQDVRHHLSLANFPSDFLGIGASKKRRAMRLRKGLEATMLVAFASLVVNETLENSSHMVVLPSFSRCYQVPGTRYAVNCAGTSSSYHR